MNKGNVNLVVWGFLKRRLPIFIESTTRSRTRAEHPPGSSSKGSLGDGFQARLLLPLTGDFLWLFRCLSWLECLQAFVGPASPLLSPCRNPSLLHSAPQPWRSLLPTALGSVLPEGFFCTNLWPEGFLREAPSLPRRLVGFPQEFVAGLLEKQEENFQWFHWLYL